MAIVYIYFRFGLFIKDHRVITVNPLLVRFLINLLVDVPKLIKMSLVVINVI
jgi:hypothetical protein